MEYNPRPNTKYYRVRYLLNKLKENENVPVDLYNHFHKTLSENNKAYHIMHAKSTPDRIAKLIKNDKTTRLTSVRKPDGKLTETPEETLNELIKHHFKDNTNISDTHVNVTLQECRNSTTAEHKINDDIFKQGKKAVEAFSPLTAAGPDGIRPIMLQRGWEYISDAFIAIAKKSFSLGYTPKTWRASASIFFTKTR